MLQSMANTDFKNLMELKKHVQMLLSVHPGVRDSVAYNKVLEVIEEAVEQLGQKDAWLWRMQDDTVKDLSVDYMKVRGKKPFDW